MSGLFILREQRAKVRAYARPWRLSRYDKRKLAKCVFIFLSGRSSILSVKEKKHDVLVMCTRAKMKFVEKMKIIGIDRVRHP